MKKLLLILLSLCLLLTLVACGEAVSVTGATVDENGDLIVTFSNGTTQNAGKVKGEDGKDGAATDAENPQGLDFYPLPDGTWAVSAGKSLYLEEVTIPATYKGKAVTCIGAPKGVDNDAAILGGGGGFNGASNLKKITIPSSVTNIGASAFEDCINLESITIPSSVTSIGHSAFSRLPESAYTVYQNGKYLGNDQDSYLYLAGMVDTSISAFQIHQNTKILGSYVFYDCRNLQSVTIPNGVKSIGDSAFNGCSSLQSITIPSGVTSIGEYVFSHCSSLQAVAIPSGVTSIGSYAFGDCSSLQSITIPSSVTSIAQSAFSGCSSLSNIYFTGTEAQWNAIEGSNQVDSSIVTFNYTA